MNYQHIYHAGHFADVFKHAVLVALTQSFFNKDTPISYLDTHAGAALYDLHSPIAQKTKSYITGIHKIYMAKNPPTIIAQYLSIVRGFNKKFKFKPRFYPGSPQIVRSLFREHDHMHLVELNESVYIDIKKIFAQDKQVSVHRQDAYQALSALLPPKERRGLVLIDPPYENPKETGMIITGLQSSLKRWATGVYALWYPRKNEHEVQVFLKRIKNAFPEQEILLTELDIFPMTIPVALNGSGMLIINPPWQLNERIKEFLPWLWQNLADQNRGGFRVEFM